MRRIKQFHRYIRQIGSTSDYARCSQYYDGQAYFEEELEEAVTALLNRYHSLKNYYDFCVNGNTVRLKLSEIYYFESAKHCVGVGCGK